MGSTISINSPYIGQYYKTVDDSYIEWCGHSQKYNLRGSNPKSLLNPGKGSFFFRITQSVIFKIIHMEYSQNPMASSLLIIKILIVDDIPIGNLKDYHESRNNQWISVEKGTV